jgi:hypothetical protein
MKRIILYILSIILVGCSSGGQESENTVSDRDVKKEKESKGVHTSDDIGGPFNPNKEQVRIAQFAKQVQSLPEIDSVIYYFEVEDSYYFVVTNGDWHEYNPWDEKKGKPNCKYGLVDEIGNVIIPIEQDKIYNYQQIVPGQLMVSRENKYSFFSLDGKKGNKKFDWVYPTKSQNEHAAIVSTADSIGYLGKNGVFVLIGGNLKISDPEIFSQIEFNWTAHSNHEFHTPWFTSIMYEAISAEGVVEFPPHLVAFGIESHEKIADVRYTEKQRKNRDGYMGVEKHEVSLKGVVTLKEKVVGVLTYLYEYSVDGRESVMREARLSSLKEDGTPANSVKVLDLRQYPICEEHSYRIVDTNMVEVSIVVEKEGYGETTYKYFQVNEKGQIDTLNKSRKYDFTHYVKIDPSYFQGCFYKAISSESDDYIYRILKRTHMTIDELDEMRNEIFAEHGYKFKSEKWNKFFESKSWYKSEFESVYDKLTEIEKYNLKVIEKTSIELRNDPSLSKSDTTEYYPGP